VDLSDLHTVARIAVTPDGTRAISGGYDRALKVWHIRQQSRGHSESSPNAAILHLGVTDCGQHLASESSDETMTVWDARTLKSVRSVEKLGSGFLGQVGCIGRRWDRIVVLF
jgi:WD40 repeat protein